MDTRSRMMLKVFINRYNPKLGTILNHFLPQEEAQRILSQNISSTDIKPIFHQSQRLVERMHYSWIIPLLEKFPKEWRPCVLASLKEEQISPLQRIVGYSPLVISRPVKTFFLNQLYSLSQAEKRLPPEYLPETELSSLASWSRKNLVTLIDFLGLYDLAAEVRRIVDRNQLKNLYNCLPPKQLAYLKICLYQKDKLVSPKLEINPAKQDCKRLRQLLHQRGLIRLGKALYGQHVDLVWHMIHVLDIRRGRIIMHYFQQQTIPEINSALKLQVSHLINFLKKSKR